MSNTVTLASIRDAAEEKFGSTIVQLDDDKTAELLNPLRLGKKKREELKKLQEREEDEGEKQTVDALEERLTAIVKLAAKTPADAKRLLDAVGDDTAVLAQVVNTWTKGEQAGEASPSGS